MKVNKNVLKEISTPDLLKLAIYINDNRKIKIGRMEFHVFDNDVFIMLKDEMKRIKTNKNRLMKEIKEEYISRKLKELMKNGR